MGRRSAVRNTTGTTCQPQVPPTFQPPEFLLPNNNKSCKRLQFHKVKKCPWFDAGKCYMGEACNYAHFPQELRPRPDLSRTRLCSSVARGEACHYARCHFAHSYNELQATSAFYKTKICQFWSFSLTCPAGASCRHAHGELELRAIVPDGSEELSRNSSFSKSVKIESFCNSFGSVKENHIPRENRSLEISTASQSPILTPSSSWHWQHGDWVEKPNTNQGGCEQAAADEASTLPTVLTTADTENSASCDLDLGVSCFPHSDFHEPENVPVDISGWMSAICLSRLCESDPDLVGRIVDSLSVKGNGVFGHQALPPSTREFEWSSSWSHSTNPSSQETCVSMESSKRASPGELWSGLPTWLLAETTDKQFAGSGISISGLSDADELLLLPTSIGS